MNQYMIEAVTDIGVEREKQEDYVVFEELDDHNLFCIIADGTSSRDQVPQPASIVCEDIMESVLSAYREAPDLFFQNPTYFLKRALETANSLLGAFKMGNEEIYSGFAASVTCALFSDHNRIYCAHAGNTRLYVIRGGNLIQMTKDHTRARTLLEENKITIDDYYSHPYRLQVTSGLGIVTNPEIQAFSGSLRNGDFILMTTDGVHYAIRPDAITNIILESDTLENAMKSLVDAAKNVVKYPDNMAAMIIANINSFSR